jgi:hypothetical protein
MMNKSLDFVRYLSRYQDVFQMKSDGLLGAGKIVPDLSAD